MQVMIIPVTPFQQNCTLMWCPETMEGAIIDPGGEIERLIGVVKEQDVKLVKILVTHGHIDHAGGVADLAERMEIPIEGPHKDDQFWIDGLAEQGDRFGTSELAQSFTPTHWLEGGDIATFGNITLQVRHCPGHTPGHVIFYHEDLKVAQVGDVLFQGSIGRTDFPRGDHATLLASIRNELWPLGDDVTFIPGHGPTSTFGQERMTNPFVSDR